MHYISDDGFIEVVCGPMFAGKTEELIRRIVRLKYAKKKVIVFKPKIDNRYTEEPLLVSHSKITEPTYVIEHSYEILEYIDDTVDAIVIDEAQFFDSGIVRIANDLADRGLRVIVGGLDMDFKGEPFGPMPYLLAVAEYVTKLSAICLQTGKPATRTQRLINGFPVSINDPVVVVGASESYEPRTRKAHELRNE